MSWAQPRWDALDRWDLLVAPDVNHIGHMPLYLLWEKGAHMLPQVAALVGLGREMTAE